MKSRDTRCQTHLGWVDGWMDGSGETAPKSSYVNEQYTSAKVSVWLCLENAYNETDAFRIKDNICSALVGKKCLGPVSFFGYGDKNQIPYSVKRALSITGIPLSHLADGEKGTNYNTIIVDMMLWAKDNPPPATYLLILDGIQVSYVAHCLQIRGYNFLLARTQDASEPILLEPAPKSVLPRKSQFWKYIALFVLAIGTILHSKISFKSHSDTTTQQQGCLDSEVHAEN